MTGRRIRENVLLSAAQTPRPTPITTVRTVATSTCDAVSIAELHSPITPISASIRNVVIAERRPLTTSEISVIPISITGHGVSTRKFRNGTSPYWTMWSPIQLVTWNRTVSGFWT